MNIETDSNRGRRVAAWGVDACIVGIPAMVVGLVVPVIPVGALVWIVYRLWAGWHGQSIGRILARVQLHGPNGATPGWRGIAHTAVAATPVVTGFAAVGVQLAALSFEPWYLWLFAVPFIVTFAVAAGALVALVIWTGGARLDRWCGITVHQTGGPALQRSTPARAGSHGA